MKSEPPQAWKNQYNCPSWLLPSRQHTLDLAQYWCGSVVASTGVEAHNDVAI